MLRPNLLLANIYATVARAKHLTSQIGSTDDATILEFRRDAELRLIGWKIIEAIDAGYTISINYKGSDPLKVSEYTDKEITEARNRSIEDDYEL